MTEIQEIAERLPTEYLRNFFAEKEVEEQHWTLTADDGVEHHISNVVVIEHMTRVTVKEANQIRNVLVKIDFHNGDVNHFLRHLAGAIINQG